MRLTDEQRAAVARRSEPLLLSAGAGSGKTSVLVERFVSAVREDGVAPAAILAITFTDRAAGELRERVRARLLELGERAAARDSEAASVGTFHGFCARLLRAHAPAVGLDPQFAILDEGIAGGLRERAFELASRAFLVARDPDAIDLIASYGIDRVGVAIEDVYARLRSRGQREPNLPPAAAADARGADGRDAIAACVLFDRLLGEFARQYARLKAERGAVDFDDLELLARSLLEGDERVRSSWSQRYALLMVDEFQDTNPRQMAILRALEHDNLFTVGDEFQSIYGFRHADVELFRARRETLAERGGSLSLTSNFRSSPALLALVNTVFAEHFSGFELLRAGRLQAPPGEDPVSGQIPLFGEPDDGVARQRVAGGARRTTAVAELLLTDRRGWDSGGELGGELLAGLPAVAPWRAAEARLLAVRLQELIEGEGVSPGDVAVLLRSGVDLDVYERALQLRGVRTIAAGGGFWRHQQVADLLAYLRVLANPLDEEALFGTLASPLVGISHEGLALLAHAAHERGRGIWETLANPGEPGPLAELPVGEQERLARFRDRLQSERVEVASRGGAELIERELAVSGYREHVLGLDWGERRVANINKLLRLARRFEAAEGPDLRGFLDHAARLQRTAGAREADAPVQGVERDAVRMMTIHAAKGLEFPVVCVADLGRAANQRQPLLLVEGDRVGLMLSRLDGAKATPTLAYEELSERRRLREAEEEDRVLYVAMTRARERLLLSGAIELDRWPKPRPGAPPITWLAPALVAGLPELVAAENAREHELALAGTPVRIVLNRPSEAAALLAPGAPVHATARVPGLLRDGEELVPPAERLAGPTSALVEPGEPGGGARAPLPLPTGREERALLSYSALSELERCAYRYYLERVLGIPERALADGDGGGAGARARGTLAHALLEAHDFTRPPRLTPERVAACAGRLGVRASPPEREELARLITAALVEPLAIRVASAQRLHRELPFAFPAPAGAGEPLIVGVIDLLAEEPDGGRLVIDYKSDRVGPGADLGAIVAREYSIQRLLYALAVLRGGAERVEIVHWFLDRPWEPVAALYTDAQRPALEAGLQTLLQRAQASPYTVSRSPYRGLCASCPGRGTLCSWGEAETMREEVPPNAPSGAFGAGS